MTEHDVPRDTLMNNPNDIKRSARGLHNNTLNDGDTYRTEACFVAETESNVKCPFTSYGSIPSRLILVVPGIELSPVSSRIRAPLMAAAGGSR